MPKLDDLRKQCEIYGPLERVKIFKVNQTWFGEVVFKQYFDAFNALLQLENVIEIQNIKLDNMNQLLKKKPSIFMLNYYCLKEILKHCDIIDEVHFSRTCKRYKQFCNAVWKKSMSDIQSSHNFNFNEKRSMLTVYNLSITQNILKNSIYEDKYLFLCFSKDSMIVFNFHNILKYPNLEMIMIAGNLIKNTMVEFSSLSNIDSLRKIIFFRTSIEYD